MKPTIAIIGAGIAGLTLAQNLKSFADVIVFEKSRGVGGRMSTRYAEPFHFDHGAQFFTARTPEFKGFIKPLIASGDIAEWTGKIVTFEAGKKPDKSMWFEPHYVAAPNMNSLCKQLAEDALVKLNVEVLPPGQRSSDGWHLTDKNGEALGCFDWVISTAPPVQTLRLFGDHLAAAVPIHKAKLLGCYTMMIGFNRPWEHQWIAATIRDNPLQWLAVNSSKPGRDKNVTCLVAHSSHEWAETHIDDNIETTQTFLMKELQAVTGIDFQHYDYVSTHRWRYANLSNRHDLPPYIDAQNKLASVGDWCAASRIENVWLSASQLAVLISKLLQT